jgi:trigger factor
MQVNVQQINPVLVEFAVEIPETDVRRAVDNAYRDLSRTAKVRGYRQGKIPRDVLTHVYGGQVVLNVQQKLISPRSSRRCACATRPCAPRSRRAPLAWVTR